MEAILLCSRKVVFSGKLFWDGIRGGRGSVVQHTGGLWRGAPQSTLAEGNGIGNLHAVVGIFYMQELKLGPFRDPAIALRAAR